MSNRVCSIEISRRQTRRILAGVLAGVLAGLGPCVGAAPAARHLAAKPSPGNQIHLMYRHTAHVGISGQALGQEVLSSAVFERAGVCVDPHNVSVLLINLDAAVPSMVSAATSGWVGNSVADVVKTENSAANAGLLGNALADVNAIGIVAANLSR